MNEFYTLKQAMERLGVKSMNAFFRMERKYPEAFVVVQQSSHKGRFESRKHIHYDKAALDRFADSRDNSKKVKP
jgi:hypothetical protein